MIGNKSWLNSNIYSSEVFPSEYNVYRKDRFDGYGGVFIACYHKPTSSQVTLDGNSSELIATQLQLDDTSINIYVQFIIHPNLPALSLLTYAHLLVK